MKYVALLRGINVGGKNKIDMKKLQGSIESLGVFDVSTYINTGNIFFTDESHTSDKLIAMIESVIQKDFGLSIKVLLRSKEQIDTVAKKLPKDWTNDPEHMKSDVMFLWEDVDSKDILEKVVVKDGIDTVIYEAGALLWSVDRTQQARSGQMQLPGTELYKHMTIRNVNTFRKIHALMQD